MQVWPYSKTSWILQKGNRMIYSYFYNSSFDAMHHQIPTLKEKEALFSRKKKGNWKIIKMALLWKICITNEIGSTRLQTEKLQCPITYNQQKVLEECLAKKKKRSFICSCVKAEDDGGGLLHHFSLLLDFFGGLFYKVQIPNLTAYDLTKNYFFACRTKINAQRTRTTILLK